MIFKIEDCDFGEVSVFYYPEKSVITAEGLSIKDVPADYDTDQIMKMWGVFKAHYNTYGMVACSYHDIDKMNEIMSEEV